MTDASASSRAAERDRLVCIREQAQQRLEALLLADTRRWAALNADNLSQIALNLPNLNQTISRAQERGDAALVLELVDYVWNYVRLQAQWRLALSWISSACEAARLAGDEHVLAKWQFRRACVHEELGEPHMADVLLHDALSLDPPPALRGDILLHLGWLAQSEIGDLETANGYLTSSETAFLLAHDQIGALRSRRQKALLQIQRGHPTEALGLLAAIRQDVAPMLQDWPGRRIAAAVELDLASILLNREAWAQAKTGLDRAADFANETPDHLLAADIELQRARLEASQGRWRLAERHCAARLEALQKNHSPMALEQSADPDVGDRSGQAAALIALGNLCLARGRRHRRRAVMLFRDARRTAGQADPYNRSVANERLGAIMSERGQHAEAQARLQDAQAGFESLDAPREAAICALRRARSACRLEHYLLAEGLCRQAIDLCHGLDTVPVIVSAHEMLAWIMERQRDWKQAADHYAVAGRLARCLGKTQATRLERRASRCQRRAERLRRKG